ncbi:MAG: tetratricopeptide repeat protein [Candidatus Latescibacteria bacterium]|nr:tetratricopeptide repeat protein [Candidatus Latescibacterota bacterium]
MAKATVRTEQLTIPTYPINPPDSNPPIDREGGYWRVYPYPMLDDLGAERQDRTYLAVVLENEFLRVTVLPELGGRLYSAYDKAAGRELFYKTRVIKPALVALRGAWIAGGLEFNFPCSHNYVTFSPVDWEARQEEDGTAAVFIGGIEHVSRMRWTVAISLRPGRAQLDTDIRLENRTGLPHRYYFWSNSAERVTPGTRFITPITTGYGWKGIMRYPVHEGEDLSWYRNHPHALDLFSRHLQGDFFGCYDSDLEEGVVNVADHHQVTGRKYFTWGHAGDGLVWQHILSDEDGPYIEIQSGPFPTQSIFKMMEPHRVHRWQETWYGVRQMGGFGYANGELALNLAAGPKGTRLAANATRPIAEAVITAYQEGEQVGSWKGSLGPASTVSFPIYPGDPEAQVEVTVSASAEGELVHTWLPWRGVEEDLVDPGLGDEEKGTVQGLVAQGYEWEKALELERARACYTQALEQDPLAVKALIRLGILDLKVGLWRQAESRLSEALRLEADAVEASFYRGQARRQLGDRSGAQRDFWEAWQKSSQFVPLARFYLGKMAAAEGRWSAALGHWEAATALETIGTRSWCLRCAALRRLGRLAEAQALAEEIRRSDPLNPLLRFEEGFIARAQGQREPFARARTLARGDGHTYLEVAADYAGSGQLEEALEVVRQAAGVADEAMVRYHLAYYLDKAGRPDEALAACRAAAAMPGDTLFAHRPEDAAALQRAMELNPADSLAPFRLGTLRYMAGRIAEGRELWLKAAAQGCPQAALYRCLGFAQWKKDRAPRAALSWYSQAVQRRSEDYRLYVEMDQLRAELGQSAKERLQALQAAPPAVRAKGTIAARLAQFYVALGEYEAAIALLHSRRFDPWEGATAMRRVYVEAHMGRGETLMDQGDFAGARQAFEQALEYPVSLGVGPSYRSADAPIRYWAGLATRAAGDEAGACGHWRQALAETHHPIPSLERTYVELCRLRLGQGAEAGAVLGAILAAAEQRQREQPAELQGWVVAGLAAQALGQEERARAALAAALRLAPQDLALGRLYARAKGAGVSG